MSNTPASANLGQLLNDAVIRFSELPTIDKALAVVEQRDNWVFREIGREPTDELSTLANEVKRLRAELSALKARVAEVDWNYSMNDAPKDGTLLLLLIAPNDAREHPLEDTENPSITIGHNNFLNDGEDVWQFAGWSWEQDYYVQGRGKPGAWKLAPIVDIDSITGRHSAIAQSRGDGEGGKA